MNARELENIETLARRAAQNDFSIKAVEDWKGRIISYVIVVDGSIYDSPSAFYEVYPHLAPQVLQK